VGNLFNGNFGSTTPDNLFADTTHPVDVKGVILKSGQGVLARGTVLGIISATGKAVAVDSSKSDGSEKADCILTDTVDTSASDAVSSAYSSGSFNRKALVFGGTDTATKHETKLRELGIFLKDVQPYDAE